MQNILLSDWDLPPFDKITADLFAPAFEHAHALHRLELSQIADNPENPTFANTVDAIDRAGLLLSRITNVFDNLCASCSSNELQIEEANLAANRSAHVLAAFHTPGLYERLHLLFKNRASLGLTPPQLQLLERLNSDFVRAGARLTSAAKERCIELGRRLATLMTRFSQNVVLDEGGFVLDFAEGDLVGCPDDVIEAARTLAASRGVVLSVSLSRSQVEPILTFADRRDIREAIFRSWTRRGELVSDRDNKCIAVEVMHLRSELAALHGYANFGEYQLDDTMAKTPSAVTSLLRQVWVPAKAAAERERAMLESFAMGEAAPPPSIQPWDWRYYAEKVRKDKYDFNEMSLKPYLSLTAMINAVFDVANKLFGLRFIRREAATYHPDVNVYDVRETNASGGDVLVAIFMHDLFSRPFKRSGAWSESRVTAMINAVFNTLCLLRSERI